MRRDSDINVNPTLKFGTRLLLIIKVNTAWGSPAETAQKYTEKREKLDALSVKIFYIELLNLNQFLNKYFTIFPQFFLKNRGFRFTNQLNDNFLLFSIFFKNWGFAPETKNSKFENFLIFLW